MFDPVISGVAQCNLNLEKCCIVLTITYQRYNITVCKFVFTKAAPLRVSACYAGFSSLQVRREGYYHIQDAPIVYISI